LVHTAHIDERYLAILAGVTTSSLFSIQISFESLMVVSPLWPPGIAMLNRSPSNVSWNYSMLCNFANYY
jgi:hypothetical protein